jgi:hypothetical protein
LLAESLSRRPLLILGDVGVGKTTFLRHLMKVDAAEQFAEAIGIHINLGSQGALAADLRQFIVQEIERQLREDWGVDVDEDGIVRATYHLEWGADPHRVDLGDLFDTYKSDLFGRFQDLGVDLTTGHALAEALAYHMSNRPLFGFAKRHWEGHPKIQTELNIPLAHHVSEENEKGVQLRLWAGANPHAPALTLRYWRGSAYDDGDNDDRHRAVRMRVDPHHGGRG